MKVQYGIWVVCVYDDGYREPEGIVMFDEYPKEGDIKTLCDGKQYKVCAVHRDLECDMTPVDAPYVKGVTP